MSKLIRCRRSIVCLVGIVACMVVGLHNHVDTSVAISMICAALAGANAAQSAVESRNGAAG